MASLLILLLLATFAPHICLGLPLSNNNTEKCGIAEVQGHHGFFPWMAHVKIGRKWCTASIVSPNFILTAAHCVLKGDTTVHVGARDFREALQSVEVVEKHRHHDFDDILLPGEIHIGDIGLLKVRLVPIDKCYYEDQDVPTYEMQIGEVNITDRVDCIPADEILSDSLHICIKPIDATPEQGDSGGPLTVRRDDAQSGHHWRQIGIASQGICHIEGQRLAPMTYTMVDPYCDWIKEKTKGEVACGDQ